MKRFHGGSFEPAGVAQKAHVFGGEQAMVKGAADALGIGAAADAAAARDKGALRLAGGAPAPMRAGIKAALTPGNPRENQRPKGNEQDEEKPHRDPSGLCIRYLYNVAMNLQL